MNCSTCDDYGVCSGTVCPDHPLMTGLVKEMMETGESWGDIVYYEHQAFLANESPTDRVLRLLKIAEEEHAQMLILREKKTRKYVSCVTGKVMGRINQPCRYANSPESVDKNGVVWPAGCEPHRKGICPYLHPGEAGYDDVQKKRTVRW